MDKETSGKRKRAANPVALGNAKQLVKQAIEQQRQQLIAMTTAFCKQSLSDEYAALCEKMIGKMARKRIVPFLSGRPEGWAAATVYALCQINFGFDRDQAVHTTADTICNFFGVSKGNVGTKAKAIRDMFKLDRWDSEEFATAYMRENNPWKKAQEMIREMGFGPQARELAPDDLDDLPMSVTNEEMMEVLGLSEADLAKLTIYAPEAGGNVLHLSDEQHNMLMAYIRKRNAEMKEHIAFVTHEDLHEVLGLSEAEIEQMSTFTPELGTEALLLSPEQLQTVRDYMAQKQKRAN
jgi:Domain of unknown function (DUF6398)